MAGYLEELPDDESDETEWDDVMAMPDGEAERYLDRELARVNAEYDAWRARLTPLQAYRVDRRSALMRIIKWRRRLRDARGLMAIGYMLALYREGIENGRLTLARLRAERATGQTAGRA